MELDICEQKHETTHTLIPNTGHNVSEIPESPKYKINHHTGIILPGKSIR